MFGVRFTPSVRSAAGPPVHQQPTQWAESPTAAVFFRRSTSILESVSRLLHPSLRFVLGTGLCRSRSVAYPRLNSLSSISTRHSLSLFLFFILCSIFLIVSVTVLSLPSSLLPFVSAARTAPAGRLLQPFAASKVPCDLALTTGFRGGIASQKPGFALFGRTTQQPGYLAFHKCMRERAYKRRQYS
jgi:hypothetical protein